MENNPQTIKEIIAEFFEKMTISVSVDVETKEDRISVALITNESSALIGENGETLSDLQQILRLVLRKRLNPTPFFFDIDINNYKQEKIDRIKDVVRGAIDEVIVMGKEKILLPMTAAERRIVHTEINSRTDVKSESIGEEPDRRVVIKPI